MSLLRWVVLFCILVVLGCGTDGAPVTSDSVSAEIQPLVDVIPETVWPETVVLPETVVPETVADVVFPDDLTDQQAHEGVGRRPACDPGEGCFLDKCQENADCLSGWCVEHMGQKVCTMACQEECPKGWTCSLMGASAPDVVFICVSDFTNLCRPCNQAADCEGVAGTQDACVSYGDEGAFCGGKCGEEEECPWGFSCQAATTVDGIELDQCVAETGLCPCTDTAVELGLFTNCQISNEFGTCEGKRVCMEEGLSDCDAAEPAEEVCNAVDDNCNGLTDEVDLVDGTPVCDDHNACTADLCNGQDGCAHEELSEGECLDGDACTIGDHCEAGVCVGQPIACDDGDVCTDDLCDGLGGCTTEYNVAACDDGDPCTVNDTCKEGACSGFVVDCECSVDADCLPLEDDSVCNGTLMCDTTKLPFLCQVDPDTVVECPDPESGPDAICLKSSCDPETGECSLAPDHEGFACEDSDLCTVGDKCVEGVCTAGVGLNCNDGNGCTDDACQPDSGCVHTDNNEACEDGDVCTTGDVCAAGGCVAGEALICDDGDVCNGQETCASDIGCQPGKPLVCEDDDDVCTDSHCDPDAGCVTVLNNALCDDDDVCTTGDHCELGVCIASGALVCNDNNECTDDSCNAQTGCMFLANSTGCDDGNACTTGDVCAGGACAGVDTSTADCDDGKVCTDDGCDPAAGCVHTLNTVSCSDGDVCTFGDACKDGACIPGEALECDDGQYCNGQEACDQDIGCKNGAAPLLDDGVDCTLDTCNEEADQVVHTPQDGLCNDNEFCNGVESCDALQGCQPGAAPSLDDQIDCTQDTCDEVADLVIHTPQDGLCNDQQFCNGVETCDVLQGCQPGAAPSLDDQIDCTQDTCDEVADQVIHTPQDGLCNDQQFCNGGETCDADEGCLAGAPPPLDDANPCTVDSCDEEGDVVVHTPIAAGQYAFGTCGQTGYTGPSQSQCDSAYSGTGLAGLVNVSGGIQMWTAPQSGLYDIEAVGAGGGLGKDHSTNVYAAGVPGKGARMSGRFSLNQGDVLHIIVGQRGSEALGYWQKGGGGGGGTFVVRADGTPLLVAGGGGGAGRYNGMNGGNGVTTENGTAGGGTGGAGGTNGSGGAVTNCGYGGNSGAGFSGNGVSACGNSYYAKSFENGGVGSDWSHCWNDGNAGGFGGGGGTGPHGGAGGGGYSGGGGGGDHNCGTSGGGGGGGSYNAGQNQDNQAGYQSGHGSVTIGIGCN